MSMFNMFIFGTCLIFTSLVVMIAYNFSVYLFFSQYFGKKTFFFISHMMFLLRLLVLNLPWFLFSRREDEVGAY